VTARLLRGPLGAVHAAIVSAALLAGCAQSGNAPVENRPVADWSRSSPPATPATKPALGAASTQQPGAKSTAAAADADVLSDTYVVKKGDTLYGIALDHGQSYRDVATWNGISDPNVIRVGQQLRVRPPPGWTEKADEDQVVTQPMAPPAPIEAKALEAPAPPPLKTGPKAVKLAYSDKALAQLKGTLYKEATAASPAAAPKPAPAQAVAPPPSSGGAPAKPPTAVQQTKADLATAPAAPAKPVPFDPSRGWAWPARGPLLHSFNSGANPKGIAIGGEAGAPVLAAGTGKVVYSGSGLRGYGRLIIIKHDENYLSVYAHNSELLVKEGQRVTQGQKIAEMGSTDAERVELHFEIRHVGKPVDPMQYLPANGA
jgi:lipoprotein NlpD